jgi:hypothetical protein
MRHLYKIFIPLFLFAVSAQAQIVITTYAGTGATDGYLGDGDVATAALLSNPTDIAFDSKHNLYICDFNNNVIRRVDTAGIITNFAGTGLGHGTTAGGSYSGNGGPAVNADLNGPYAIAIDKHDNVYFADGYNHVVRKVDTAGIITLFAGDHGVGYSGDNDSAIHAQLNNPVGLAVDDTGNVFIADDHNNVIRKVNTAGIITTYAGNDTTGHTGNGGPARAATLNLPLGVAIDKKGNLYIADAQNNVVRKVDTAHIISDFAGYDTTHGYMGDGGPATAAQLYYPVHLSVDDSFNVYIADADNSVVRKVNAAGIITTIAGNDSFGFSGDGGDPLLATLYLPHAAVKGPDGFIYIADRGNMAIRRIGPADHTSTTVVWRNGNALQAYPNPSNGKFVLKVVSTYNEEAKIVVCDVMGRVVNTFTATTNQSLTLSSGLAPGTYFVNATTAHGSWKEQLTVK